jgi:hypothetical protein
MERSVMAWLPITNALPGDVCPRCGRGELYIRSSFPADLARIGAKWERLPDAIKSAILALVQAAGDRDA